MVVQNSPMSYKTISTLLSYVQRGNVTTTTLALICLNEALTFDTACIQALIDGKTVTLLLNVIEANFSAMRRAQFSALGCLSKLCECRLLQKDVLCPRGVSLLFQCLDYATDYEWMCSSIRLIADISPDALSWEPARECGGIQKLIHLLSAHHTKITCPSDISKADILKLKLTVAQYAAKSLSILCQDEENRRIACTSNIINICQFWIRSKHQQVTIPILILLQHLSLSVSFRKQVNDANMYPDVLHHLRSTNVELKQAAADFILICADNQGTFKCFYKQEFVAEVFQMLSNSSEDEALMTSISGIIWKCSKNRVCIPQFETLNVMPVFTQLLESQPVQVKSYIVGAIGMCMKNTGLREMIKKTGGIEIMVNFLQTTYIPLIINLNEALAKASEDSEILVQYLQLDAVQLIWSCLKNSNIQVQSSAASALCIILRNIKHANLSVENSLDGIECIIDLLISKRKELLTPACTLIHNLAQDKNALSALVEFNVASHLMRLMKTNDPKLLQQLCLAVASCCSFQKGCEKFAACGITLPLLKHLRAKNKSLRITAASALSKIASLPNWCSVSSQNKIIPILTKMLLDVKFKDGNESAAIILRHILCNVAHKESEEKI